MNLRNGHSNKKTSFSKLESMKDEMRGVSEQGKYNYLAAISQYSFQPITIQGYWFEGYPLSITPIHREDSIYLIEFSLENGDFVLHPFAAKSGDRKYQKLLSVLGVETTEGVVPTSILVKKCKLLISSKLKDGVFTYFLHDVANNF
ncbi:hypothetical protein J5S49_04890 [Virgibacillus halodenitrificans]|uniref:hypothetical protein n=1 Tax=Virgibacillus halodenitrificans TaxID=1482 RepID=UPI001F380730|nr:hypothetical protein [Virgibacillus halodenitrificans]MCG1027618.1 hypothetical protein [Virgibacillus halodenitrificans]